MSKTVTLPFEEHERLLEIEKKVKNGPVLTLKRWVVYVNRNYSEYNDETFDFINLTGETVDDIIKTLKEGMDRYQKDLNDLRTERKKLTEEIHKNEDILKEASRIRKDIENDVKKLDEMTFFQRLIFVLTGNIKG